MFAFSLYLLQGNRNQAYDVTASAFAEVARNFVSPEKVLIELVRVVLKLAADMEKLPSVDENDFGDLKSVEKNRLSFVRRMLQSLPLKTKVAVLLRDQLNLGYRQMADIFQTSENEIRHQTLQARQDIRAGLEKVLRDAR